MRGKLGWGRACLRILRKGSGPARLQAQLYTSQGKLPHLSPWSLSLPTNDTWTPSYQPSKLPALLAGTGGMGRRSREPLPRVLGSDPGPAPTAPAHARLGLQQVATHHWMLPTMYSLFSTTRFSAVPGGVRPQAGAYGLPLSTYLIPHCSP